MPTYFLRSFNRSVKISDSFINIVLYKSITRWVFSSYKAKVVKFPQEVARPGVLQG